MNVSVVIPTRGDRHHYIEPMVDILGDSAIIVHTSTQSRHLPGVLNLEDYGPINIHRWWNTGIKTAPHDYVAVLNDDLRIGYLTVPALADALAATGATLAHHDTTQSHHTRLDATPTPGQVVRTAGWCWMLDRRHGILPDERYRWWYGDNDLALRALTEGHGIATTPLGTPEHLHPNHYTRTHPELQTLAQQDQATYTQLHS